jgi:hypothetical protein
VGQIVQMRLLYRLPYRTRIASCTNLAAGDLSTARDAEPRNARVIETTSGATPIALGKMGKMSVSEEVKVNSNPNSDIRLQLRQ